MLLRLDNKPRTFDFRPGNNGWGHAIHASTFRAAAPRIVKRGWLRKPLKIDRVSVMVHCQYPRVGDSVIYQGESGKIWTCEIVDIDPCYDPGDMFTLVLEERSGSNDPTQ